MPSGRVTMPVATSTSVATMPIAASTPDKRYKLSRSALMAVSGKGRPRSRGALYISVGLLELAVGVEDGLAVRAGLLDPLGGHLLADLEQLGLQRLGRRLDRHLVGLELVDVPGGLLFRDLPAALLGRGGGLEQRVARGLVERVEGL